MVPASLRMTVALSVLLAVPAGAISTVAIPQFHGVLRTEPVKGSLVRTTTSATATVKVRNWSLVLQDGSNGLPPSNGIFPDQEPVVIAFSSNVGFPLPAGALRPSHHGKVFTYHAPRGSVDGIRMLRIRKQRDGSYGLRFTVSGIEVTALNNDDPVCMALAVIIGDDDGFTGIYFTSPTFDSRVLRLTRECTAGWPWE